MSNDYYRAEDLPQQFGQATAEAMQRRFREVAAGFDKLPAEDRLKRGLVGTGEDVATDADTVAVTTGDVPFGSYTAYSRAQLVGWVAKAANTGAVEISVDGGPTVPLVDSGLQPLVANHLVAGAFVQARYTGTSFSIVAATATIGGGEGFAFTREQILAIVREALLGGGGQGSLVISDVEMVSSAAELAAVSVIRRVAVVVVDAPFDSYRENDVLVWDNAREPGQCAGIYTEPPASVVPGESEPLGALVAPETVARLVLLRHETDAGELLLGSMQPRVRAGLAFTGRVGALARSFGELAPVVSPGLSFTI